MTSWSAIFPLRGTEGRPSMRKYLLLFLILTALAAAACSGQEEAPEPASQAVTEAPVPEEESSFRAAVFYYDYGDPYISSVRTDLSRDLVEAGIPYTEYDASSRQSIQNGQIDEALLAGADLLIVNLVSSGSSDAADSICMKAQASGVPVIFFNRAIEEDGAEGVLLDYYDHIAFVGTDPAEAGHLQGDMIGRYLIENYKAVDLNGDGQISYALFKGEAANVEAIYRTRYAVEDADALLEEAGYPPLVYFDPKSVDGFQLDLTGKWSLSAARDYMTTNLQYYNDDAGNMIELVICNNDNMAEGAIRALETVGYNTGEEGAPFIPVFGVDATASARLLISQGKMTGTVVQDASSMAACIRDMAVNAGQGLPLTEGLSYPTDTEHDLPNRICIPYSVYAID